MAMEEEDLKTLQTPLSGPAEPKENLAEIIRRRFGPLGGVDLELPEREPMREPPDFGQHDESTPS
jgi:hypothetical protein